MQVFKFIALALPIVLMACSVSEETTQAADDKEVFKIETVESIDTEPTSDPYTIQNVNIEGDVLAIEICFGGCDEHTWRLITTKKYKKSLPPQVDLYLIHDQHDSECKRQNCDTLYFDVSELKYPGKPENYTVTLNIQKSNKSVNYEY